LDIPAYVPPKKRVLKRKALKGGETSGVVRVPQFRLVDPRVSYPELYPHRKPRGVTPRRERRTERTLLFRMTSFDGGPPVEAWAEADPDILPDDPITAVAICRRLQAVHHALNDLPKQAQRMVREIAKRNAAPVDEILSDCQWLARDRETSPLGV